MDGQLEQWRIVRLRQVIHLTALARATIYRKVSDGSFPPSVRLGTRSVGWRLSDIDAWLSAPERRWNPSEAA